MLSHTRGREPMAHKPDVALLITTSGSFVAKHKLSHIKEKDLCTQGFESENPFFFEPLQEIKTSLLTPRNIRLKILGTLLALMEIHLKICSLYGSLSQKGFRPLQYALTQIYLGRSHICRSLFSAILVHRKKGLRNAVL